MQMSQWMSHSVNVGPTFFAGETSGHKIYGDVPPELGGNDMAMIPPMGMLVALGNCMGMEIALACKNKGIPYAGLTVDVEAEWDEQEHFLHDFKMSVHMPETRDEHARRTVEAAAKMCTVRNTLLRGAQVDLEIE
jgi:putative redox protein